MVFVACAVPACESLRVRACVCVATDSESSFGPGYQASVCVHDLRKLCECGVVSVCDVRRRGSYMLVSPRCVGVAVRCVRVVWCEIVCVACVCVGLV